MRVINLNRVCQFYGFTAWEYGKNVEIENHIQTNLSTTATLGTPKKVKA